jgi:hypothetical protein
LARSADATRWGKSLRPGNPAGIALLDHSYPDLVLVYLRARSQLRCSTPQALARASQAGGKLCGSPW